MLLSQALILVVFICKSQDCFLDYTLWYTLAFGSDQWFVYLSEVSVLQIMIVKCIVINHVLFRTIVLKILLHRSGCGAVVLLFYYIPDLKTSNKIRYPWNIEKQSRNMVACGFQNYSFVMCVCANLSLKFGVAQTFDLCGTKTSVDFH